MSVGVMQVFYDMTTKMRCCRNVTMVGLNGSVFCWDISIMAMNSKNSKAVQTQNVNCMYPLVSRGVRYVITTC